MKRYALEKIFSLIMLLLISQANLMSQSEYESEGEMIKAAESLFDQGQYSKVLPLYSQLVSLYPKDGNYNMKYGYSLLHAERDKSTCLKYLKYAVGKSDAEPIAAYYYARGLHANYDLNKAIKYYKKYQTSGNSKEVLANNVSRKIEMCNNGKSLLANIFDLNVIDKKEIDRNEFFRIYELGDIGGKIIVKPDEFKSKLDLKLGGKSLIHISPESRVIYYSGYGDDKEKGLDIFRRRKKSSGEWSEPENLGSPVNTPYDEDYPFMHPDGTLYFSSKGHNSMGGFDLFKSVYNESTDTWSVPENLNFAVSSSFDDILFISDLGNQLAYFASDRASIDGKILVYRVQISRKPFDLAFLSGRFISESEEDIKSAKITIYDLEDNSKVGTYFTNKEDGTYNIRLPKSGRSYKFVVETNEDSPVHTGKVEIPEQSEIASLQQEIRLVGSGDNQKLVIKNLFDPSSRSDVDEESMMALLRSASNLEINSSEEEVLSKLETTSSPEADDVSIKKEEPIAVQHEKLQIEIASLSGRMEKEISELDQAIAFGYKYSLDKSREADLMYDEVEDLRQEMEAEQDLGRKKLLLNDLLAKRRELEPKASDAIVSYDFTQSLVNERDEKNNDLSRMRSVQSEIKSKGSDLSTEEMENNLNDYGPKVEDLKSMKSVYDMSSQRYSELIASTSINLVKQEAYYNDILSDLNAVKSDIQRLDKEITETKSKKAKSQLTAEKGAKEIDLEDLNYEYEEVKEKYTKLKIEKRSLQSDSKQLSSFISAVKSNGNQVAFLEEDELPELQKSIEYLKDQRYIEDVIGEEYDDFIAGNENKTLKSAQKYAAVDNSGNSVDYDELYLVNLAGLELIADGVKKNEEMSTMYQNWSETVAEDRRIQENHLQFTEKKADKEVINEKIIILDKKEIEYQMKSEEYSEAALAIANPIATSDESQIETKIENQNQIDTNESSQKSKQNKGGEEKLTEIGVTGKQIFSLGAAAKLASTTIDLNEKEGKDVIDDAYESEILSLETAGLDPSSSTMNKAALELNWAKSLQSAKGELENELIASGSREEQIEIQKKINDLDLAIDKHSKAASSEFTDFEISLFLGEIVIEANQNYVVEFDPEMDREHYNAKYNEIIKEIEVDENFDDVQRNKLISEVHNYWSMTIQDDILYQSKAVRKSILEDEKTVLRSQINELEDNKSLHISESNRYFKLYKELESGKIASTGGSASEKLRSGAEDTEEVSVQNSYKRLAALLKKEENESSVEIATKEESLAESKNKLEKQQLGLALVLLIEEKKQDYLALVELEENEEKLVVNEEAEREMASNIVGWQEEAEDYVFSKKDFNQKLVLSSSASYSYTKAQEYYREVESLEKQKQALLHTEVIDKNAEQQIFELQQEIEENKLQTYIQLSKSNNLQYAENKRLIEAFLTNNPNLEKDNPKLWRQIRASQVIYQEVEKYQNAAAGFESKALKFDIYDQAQFMSEYVLDEQVKIIDQLKAEDKSGELAFMIKTSSNVSESRDYRPVNEASVQDFKITEDELSSILAKDAFVEYEKDQKAIEDIYLEQGNIEIQVNTLDVEIENRKSESDSFKELALNSKKNKRKRLFKEAEVIDSDIKEVQKKKDSLGLASVRLEERKDVIRNNSQKLLASENPDTKQNMLLLAEVRDLGLPDSAYVSKLTSTSSAKEDLSVVKTGKVYSTILDDRDFVEQAAVVPKVLEGDLFVKATSTTVSPYSANKPIPIDEGIPEGLVFKVQVGAFRNPIPQDLFKGFAPLMGERIPNGITRYTAGLFRDFGNANRAKNEIRKMGYDDAFVVGFMDGKRISFQELRNVENIDLTIPPLTDTGPDGPRIDVPSEVLTTPSLIDDEGEVSSAIAEQTINTKSVSGIFFTVQVGVYTNTLLPGQLSVVRELNSELLDNGNIRYSAGQFLNIEGARQRQGEIVNQGVSDAFVTAYENGTRITVSEALQKSNQ